MFLRDDEAILCNTMLSLRSYESFHTHTKNVNFIINVRTYSAPKFMKKFICSGQTNQKLMRKGTAEVNDVNQEPARRKRVDKVFAS